MISKYADVEAVIKKSTWKTKLVQKQWVELSSKSPKVPCSMNLQTLSFLPKSTIVWRLSIVLT